MYKCTGKKMSIRTWVISKFEKIILLYKERFLTSGVCNVTNFKNVFRKKRVEDQPTNFRFCKFLSVKNGNMSNGK